jgi:predicted MFS family arabinose efflux permease
MLYLVAFAAFLGPFTQTIYAPILHEIGTDFKTSQFLVNMSISIFTMVLAAMQMIYGPLTDAKGRRKVLLPGIALYVLASIGCYCSHSIGQLLFFRALQAAGIAAGSVVATSVIGDLFEGTARGRAMGTFQMLVALGPVLGPAIGGFIGGKFGYQGIFLVLSAAGLLMLAANFRFLVETKPDFQPEDRFSVRDFWTILSNPTGSAIILLGFIQYYSFYNFLVFLPEILTHNYGLTAERKGLVFLPLSLLIVIGSYLGGRLQERVEPRKSLIAASFLNMVSIVLFIFLSNVSLMELIVSISMFGIFFGLSLPVQTTLLTEQFVKGRATAIGFYNFSRYMGMAAGPLVGSFLYRWGRVSLLFGFSAAVFAGAVWYARRQLKSRRGFEHTCV